MAISEEKKKGIVRKLKTYPYYHHLKMDWIWFDALDQAQAEACLALPFTPAFSNLEQGLHGGATASLIDTANNLALLAMTEAGASLSLVQLNINYLAPVTKGWAVALAKVNRIGHRAVFAEVTVVNTKEFPGQALTQAQFDTLAQRLARAPRIATSQGTYWVRESRS